MAGVLVPANQLTLFSPLTSQPAVPGTEAPKLPTAGQNPWNQVLGELHGLRDLEDDWDGQGTSAPEVANVDSALIWVEQMRGRERALPPSQVVPGVAGEVYLVWQGPGLFLEAEMSSPNQVEWLLASDGQPARQWKTDRATLWLVGPIS